MSRIALVVFSAAALCFAPPLLAQNVPDPSSSQKAKLPARVGPPAATATAAELEEKADELRVQKQFTDAIDYYRAALKKQKSATLYNKLGLVQLQLQRLHDARKNFKLAIKADRNAPEGYNNLGATYYFEGKYDRAVKDYQRAVNIRETMASAHSNLGSAYFAKKQFDKAVAEYRRALQLDPEIFERHAQTGIAAHVVSREDSARYSYEIAKIYADSGDLDRSLSYLRRALEDGYKGIDEVYQDKEFAELRKDPRFSELMARKPLAIPQ